MRSKAGMMRSMTQQPNYTLIYLLLIWASIWKGLALWRAAKEGNKYWFIPMLIFNTVGLLEIIYLFRFAKHRLTVHEITGWFKHLRRKSK